MTNELKKVLGAYKYMNSEGYEEYVYVGTSGFVRITITRDTKNKYDEDHIEISSVRRPLELLTENDFRVFALSNRSEDDSLFKRISYNDFLAQYKKAIRNVGDHFNILDEDKMSANRKIQKKLDKIIDGNYYKVDEF
jgi:hypothetical protein